MLTLAFSFANTDNTMARSSYSSSIINCAKSTDMYAFLFLLFFYFSFLHSHSFSVHFDGTVSAQLHAIGTNRWNVVCWMGNQGIMMSELIMGLILFACLCMYGWMRGLIFARSNDGHLEDLRFGFEYRVLETWNMKTQIWIQH